MLASPSSQSPPQLVQPSPSASKSSSMRPSPSLSAPSQTSGSPPTHRSTLSTAPLPLIVTTIDQAPQTSTSTCWTLLPPRPGGESRAIVFPTSSNSSTWDGPSDASMSTRSRPNTQLSSSNSNSKAAPQALSSGTSIRPSPSASTMFSARMSRPPRAVSFWPGWPACPPAPMPGPPKSSLGVPRSKSPPVGSAESKPMPSEVTVCHTFIVVMCTPQPAYASATSWPARIGLPAASVSKSTSSGHMLGQTPPSSMAPSQSLSTESHTSVASGLIAGSSSSQSPSQVVQVSPSTSKPSSTPPLQLSSMPLQTSVLPGKTLASPSSQSPSQIATPSPSASTSSAGITPSQSLSSPSHSSGAPG